MKRNTEQEEDNMEIVAKPAHVDQANHNKPRKGFTHNCYCSGLGRLFQKTCKGGMEMAIGKAWQVLLRYRCNGDAKKIREGKKDPDTAFVYDDPMFELLNRTLKDTARDYLTDNDSKRKQEIVCQSIDMLLMLAFEDIYYRPLLKREIQNVILAFAEHPELLELDTDERRIDCVFNSYKAETYNRIGRENAFRKAIIQEAEGNDSR
jgi:hypothetical protein